MMGMFVKSVLHLDFYRALLTRMPEDRFPVTRAEGPLCAALITASTAMSARKHQMAADETLPGRAIASSVDLPHSKE